MKRCYFCFKDYDKSIECCPYCGQKENSHVEARYLEKGVVLINRYLIGEVVGAGGFGVTYAAWDKVLEQRVAIKEYLPGEFSTRMPGITKVTVYGGEKTEQFEAGKEKFLEESRRLAKVQKIPGIVQIYNSFQENGTVYIVMEYLEGETLEEKLKREGKIPEQDVVQIMLPVLQALEVVHKEGILHRDIAPNNIFLAQTGEVKLLDFGAARSATGTHSKSLTVLYKEGYTAEEQYRSRGDQGTWTDVYACAATMYRMLTGEVPPGAMERRRRDTLKEPSKMGIKISKNVNIAIMNALSVDIKHRTQSIEEFVKELLGGTTVQKHYVRTIERKVGRIPRRIKVTAGVLGSAAVVFLILLYTGFIHFEIAEFGTLFVPEGKSRVPNIVNMEVEIAEQKLGERKLEIKILDKQFSEEIPRNKILSQSQEAGIVVEQGITVEVVVSGGSKNQENGYELQEGETFVPDIQYRTAEDAGQLIEDAGLLAEISYRLEDAVERGLVIEQSREAGSVVQKGETLSYVLNDEEPIVEEEPEEIEEVVEEVVVEVTTEGFNAENGYALLAAVNGYRESNGIAPLAWDSECESIAKSCTEQWKTADRASIPQGYWAIGRGGNSVKTAQKAVDDWMTGVTYADGTIPSESTHILNTGYTKMGGCMYYFPHGDKKGKKYHWAICFR